MKLRDVPLGFLPTFEAAGRLGSFAAAAAELHLTPSAISQQIRTLEDTLGVQLFARNGRAAMLTDEGERYLVEVRRSLAELAASTERLQRRQQGRVMRLSTVAMAAHEFVLPRLRAFRERFPDIELRIETCNDIVDLRLRGYDAAIRVSGKDDELVSQRMGGLEAAVVCAPELAREIRSASDLARFTLLDFSGHQELQLQALQREARIPVTAPANVMSFESCFEALRAAEHGIGVTFAMFPVATPWVTAKRLAVPLDARLHGFGDVYFVHPPPQHADEPRLQLAQVGEFFCRQYAALAPLPTGRIAPD